MRVTKWNYRYLLLIPGTVTGMETTVLALNFYFKKRYAILRRKLPIERIVYRDTQSYFGILLDDNNRKPLCRLHLNGHKKSISLFNENKREIKKSIQTIDDVYLFETELLETVGLYEVEL